jgi:hypothetical protein
MPKLGINFRQLLAPGSGLKDKIDPHVLGPTEAAYAAECQLSDGLLRKGPGWLKLAGVSPTGYAVQCDGTTGMGVSFPDHADYDLGRRWTIDATYKATNLSAQNPIYWRADDSNNQITSLECTTGGAFLFTHRDSNGTETTLTSAHTISAGGQAGVRVTRFFSQLRMWVDGKPSAVRNDIADYDTAPADNKWYVGVGTVTNGDTVTGVASCVGHVDEFRVFRDEILDDPALYAFCEYPWLGDERLVLYARFNETTGDVTDYSRNANDGTALASPTRDASALVTPLAPILQLEHMETSDKAEKKWLVWTNGALYGVDVV